MFAKLSKNGAKIRTPRIKGNQNLSSKISSELKFNAQIPSAAKNMTPSENGAQPAKIALSNKFLRAEKSRRDFAVSDSFSFIVFLKFIRILKRSQKSTVKFDLNQRDVVDMQRLVLVFVAKNRLDLLALAPFYEG